MRGPCRLEGTRLVYMPAASRKEAEELAPDYGWDTRAAAEANLRQIQAPPTDPFYAKQYNVFECTIPTLPRPTDPERLASPAVAAAACRDAVGALVAGAWLRGKGSGDGNREGEERGGMTHDISKLIAGRALWHDKPIPDEVKDAVKDCDPKGLMQRWAVLDDRSRANFNELYPEGEPV